MRELILGVSRFRLKQATSVMVLHNTGWRWSLGWPTYLAPRLLPPYSLELNYVRRPWPCLSQHRWSDRCYD